MASPLGIRITLQGPPISAAARLLERTSHPARADAEDSPLLSSIRAALRGSGTDPVSTVHSSSFTNGWMETEITWNAHTVILSSAGVIRKKWNFDEEGQPIQWACLSYFQMTTPTSPVSSSSASRYTSDNDTTPSWDHAESSAFGPFTLAQQERERHNEHAAVGPAVYVFLRSIGKIFLLNGLEYTFSLPFIVRKAWALHPHGVMIQRVLDPSEIEEAELTGDDPLPTIFSMTSPFSEPASVGVTSGILGGNELIPDALEDEIESSSKPLRSLPATEIVVWVNHRAPGASEEIIVTMDVHKCKLSIWRYAYIKPKDTPIPLAQPKSHERDSTRRQASMHTGNRRQSNRATEALDQLSSLMPNGPDTNPIPMPEFPEMPPFSALPGRAPALSNTATLASLGTGPSSQWSEPEPGRRDSLTRNDLSVTMDRMVLGGRMEVEAALAPVEHGRMRATYWMEKLYSHDILEAE